MTTINSSTTTESLYPVSEITVETITPEMAERWIATQNRPRSAQSAAIECYRRAYESGNWLVDPSLHIAFNHKGQLIDGQTRLYAIIKHGKPITMCVRWNTPDEIILASVNTRARTYADQMVMSGLAERDHATIVASVGRLLWVRVNRGKLFATTAAANGTVRLSGLDIAQVYEKLNLDSQWIASQARRIYRLAGRRTRLFSQAAIGYALAQRAGRALVFLETLVADDCERTLGQMSARRFLNNLHGLNERTYQHYALAVAHNEPARKRIVRDNEVPDLVGGIFDRNEVGE